MYLLFCTEERTDGFSRVRELLRSFLADDAITLGGKELFTVLADGDIALPSLMVLGVGRHNVGWLPDFMQLRKVLPTLPVLVVFKCNSALWRIAMKTDAYTHMLMTSDEASVLHGIAEILRGHTPAHTDVTKEDNSPCNSDALFVAQSPSAQALCRLARMVASTTSSVLITGESGVGKERLAKMVHGLSPRKAFPFLSLHCATLSEMLVESQLFGHMRGAFTGAVTNQRGLLDAADRGTLFLDGIDGLSLDAQAKLLRVIQEQEFIPLGSTVTKRVDIRFIAATTRSLAAMVASGHFREDLFYRINVFSLDIPPLRQRVDDIIPLAEMYLKRSAQQVGKHVHGYTEQAMDYLVRQSWPGNIRELINLIERAVVMCNGEFLDLESLRKSSAQAGESLATEEGPVTLADHERWHIRRVLLQVGNDKSQAARLLGISRKTLDRKLNQYGVVIVREVQSRG